MRYKLIKHLEKVKMMIVSAVTPKTRMAKPGACLMCRMAMLLRA
jgi:hypothetical protein